MKMVSLEAIQWVDAPNLESMSLWGNHFITLKSLTKNRFNLLHVIRLDSDLAHS